MARLDRQVPVFVLGAEAPIFVPQYPPFAAWLAFLTSKLAGRIRKGVWEAPRVGIWKAP